MRARTKPFEAIPNDDLGYCNCADCGRVLLGELTAERLRRGAPAEPVRLPPKIAGRVFHSKAGRLAPYCAKCLAYRAMEGCA